jgi:hypothetical protein
MTLSPLQRLRLHAISQSLLQPATLQAAIERLGFVQADPIRSPARAQDLILRHRVKAYRAGDLERRYESLGIEEGVLYAYGFLTRNIWKILHVSRKGRWSRLEQRVLEIVSKSGPTHPSELEAHLGRKRVVNAWGGYSKATTRALEYLHYHGLLRVVRRENGIRIYESAPERDSQQSDSDRLRKLVMVMINILAPAPLRTIQANIGRYRAFGKTREILDQLLREGEVVMETIDGLSYVWPAVAVKHEHVERRVRFLAPFDPIVWDRLRFEHLWGWPYRFEAYTPVARRVRGYYAMPLLWGDAAVGWANARVEDSQLIVDLGFVGKRPAGREFQRELDAEIESLRAFLVNRLGSVG